MEEKSDVGWLQAMAEPQHPPKDFNYYFFLPMGLVAKKKKKQKNLFLILVLKYNEKLSLELYQILQLNV
jgi:hypothetical protein